MIGMSRFVSIAEAKGALPVRKGLTRCIAYMALCGLACFPLGRLIKAMKPDWEKPPYAPWRWEDSGRAYERVGIRRWKDFVPDVSKLFSFIVPPKAFSGRPDAAKLRDMLMETCVAELVHYILCAAGLPMLRLWPGPGGMLVFLIYVVLGNIPFILIQRYNRPRFRRMLSAAEARENRLAHAAAGPVEG